MNNFDLLTEIYITYDDSLTDITYITGDLEKSWNDYVAKTDQDIEFNEFKESFITLDDLPYMLSIEDFEYSDYVDNAMFYEILIAQWLYQIKRHDAMLEIGEDICLEYSQDIDIWIYRQRANAFEFVVTKNGIEVFDSELDQYNTFEDALKVAIEELCFREI